MMIELIMISPVRNVPEWTSVEDDTGLRLLAKQKRGVILNHPIVGGNPYLYEQIIHKQPMLATLNFPNNRLGKKIWKMLERGCDAIHYKKPIYLVIHPMRKHRPQPEDRLVEKALSECSILYSDRHFIIVELNK